MDEMDRRTRPEEGCGWGGGGGGEAIQEKLVRPRPSGGFLVRAQHISSNKTKEDIDTRRASGAKESEVWWG